MMLGAAGIHTGLVVANPLSESEDSVSLSMHSRFDIRGLSGMIYKSFISGGYYT